MFEQFLQDETATIEAGVNLGAALELGSVVFLKGTLGAGKTTFCKGILKSFNHSGAVKSPTYTLVEPYQVSKGTIYHFDLYRLADPEELEFMGIRDYFKDDAICLVEWSERGLGVIPSPDIVVSLTPVKRARQLTIESKTSLGAEILTKLNKSISNA